MSNSGRHLDSTQIAELERFIVGLDRETAGIFMGRKSELQTVRARLRTIISRGGDYLAAADIALFVQGPPGVGKSSLLARIAEEWPLGVEGSPAAVFVDAGLLKLPMDDLAT